MHDVLILVLHSIQSSVTAVYIQLPDPSGTHTTAAAAANTNAGTAGGFGQGAGSSAGRGRTGCGTCRGTAPGGRRKSNTACALQARWPAARLHLRRATRYAESTDASQVEQQALPHRQRTYLALEGLQTEFDVSSCIIKLSSARPDIWHADWNLDRGSALVACLAMVLKSDTALRRSCSRRSCAGRGEAEAGAAGGRPGV